MNPHSSSKFQPLMILPWVLMAFGGFAGRAIAQRLPESARGPSVASQAPFIGKESDYAGWETCAGCHRAEAESYAKTPHAPVGEPLPASPPETSSTLSPAAAAGKRLYDDMMCAGCHTIAGLGGKGGGELGDVGVRRTREELLNRMQGRRAGTVMPTLPRDMSDEKISDLVDYLMTLDGKAPEAAIPHSKHNFVTGCETCHGPGQAHANAEEDAAGDPAKELAGTQLIYSFKGSPKENSERCMTCHVTSHEQEGFAHSQHAAAGIACSECHVAHLVTEAKNATQSGPALAQAAFFQVPQLPEQARWLHNSLLKQSEPTLCFSCHGNVQAQFALPVHHRVPEGLIKCSDCHSPHGSINRSSLNATNWETCVKCHVEKRGPYVYEHAAVRVEGCIVCHTPHGSTNRMLLVRREGRMLCLQCHSGFHAQAQTPHSRLGFQASGECTRCHVSIHGSNLDVDFLR